MYTEQFNHYNVSHAHHLQTLLTIVVLFGHSLCEDMAVGHDIISWARFIR